MTVRVLYIDRVYRIRDSPLASVVFTVDVSMAQNKSSYILKKLYPLYINIIIIPLYIAPFFAHIVKICKNGGIGTASPRR